MLAPALRDRLGLSLVQVGVVLAASFLGSTLLLIPGGLLADRVGERPVMAVGLAGAGIAIGAAAWSTSFGVLVALLVAAGASGASVNSASGRAVMHWFGPDERGLALGIRQTAIPIGGAAASLVLVHLSMKGAFLALAASLAAGSALAAALLRDNPGAAEEGTTARQLIGRGRALAPLGDGRIWRLSTSSAFLLAPQICLVGFTALFLHDRRGFSPGAAAAVVGAVQVLGIGARIAAGRWSDLLGSRIVPLRRLAVGLAVAVALVAALVPTPRPVLVPALVIAGVLAMSWNGLSFTATAELAGPARTGTAIGLQQTVLALSAAALPVPFAALVAVAGWPVAFALLALLPLVGWRMLSRLSG